MEVPTVGPGAMLTADDRADLRRLVPLLRPAQHDIAVRWSRQLIDLLPDYFSGDASAEGLTAVNESFLSLVLDHIERDNLDALFSLYYVTNRRLIDTDLDRAPALRISLSSLYTSARVSLRIIEEQLAGADPRLLVAYIKLLAELMMVVGQAYSDAREEYLQRAFEQINTLSHELKAPLANLFGYLELLQVGDFGPVSAQQEEVLRQLLHECDDLLWLLTGTLDLSRLEAGRVAVHIEEFGLHTVIADVVKSVPRRAVPLTCSIPPDLPPLRTDRLKVKQIVGNLVRNAVRYGEGTPVSVAAAMADPATIEISVRDQGPGISPTELQTIFEFFERGQAVGPARDGYGIGLHVVRRLVALLGGAVTVDSAPGAGACFRFTLPLRAAPNRAAD